MPEDTFIHLVSDATNTEPTPQAASIPTLQEPNTAQPSKAASVTVTLTCNIDLPLLRRQKRALIAISEGAIVSYEQEEAAEGMLNMLDFLQDSILEQGLASEEEIFPRLPQLFDSEPSTQDAAA